MTSISQRAIAASEYPRDPTDRDRLREEWRVAAVDHAKKKDLANRLDEGRKILLSVMITELVDSGMPVGKAENLARSSAKFQDHCQDMHAAKLAADLAWVEAEDKDRIYWSHVSEEANMRSEKRLAR
jgi:hypothetical protein